MKFEKYVFLDLYRNFPIFRPVFFVVSLRSLTFALRLRSSNFLSLNSLPSLSSSRFFFSLTFPLSRARCHLFTYFCVSFLDPRRLTYFFMYLSSFLLSLGVLL